MADRIDLPPNLQGDEKAQLQQLWSYLYQMSQALNNNLDAIGGNELTDSERSVMQKILSGDEVAGGLSEMETLKSLIIKTADFVQTSLTEYRMNLLGSTVASGQFGRYVRNTGLDVEINPEGITQNFSFQEIVQGLKHYEINAKNYIKTGLLRTVSSIPVYGVAIGKDVVTFDENGNETYVDGNKVAELTADELSFWQNGAKVAGYTGNRISFYYNGTECFYIQNGKMYAAADLEINSGKKLIIASGADMEVASGGNLKVASGGGIDIRGSGTLALTGSNVSIKSGSTFDVESTNFKISSSDKKMNCGNNTFDNTGFTYEDGNGRKIYFGNSANVPNNTISGVLGKLDDTNSRGAVEIYASPYNKQNYASLTVECRQVGNYFYSLFYPNSSSNANVNLFPSLGAVNKRFYDLYVTDIICAQIVSNDYRGATFEFYLDPDFDSTDITYVPKMYMRMDYAFNYPAKPNIEIITKNSTAIEFKERIITNYATITNLTYTNLTQTSSKDIKHNIQDLPSLGEKLDRLQPVTFVYDEDENEKQRMGLIYEDTVEVMPEICTGDESNKAINYVELIPALLKEIQELRARVKALEEREE